MPNGAAWVDPPDGLVVDRNPPIGGTVETGDQPQQCRLAAAGRSEQRDDLTRVDLDVDVAQDGVRSERPVDVTKRHTSPAPG